MPDPDEVRAALARLAAGHGAPFDGSEGTLPDPTGSRLRENNHAGNPASATPGDLPPDNARTVVDVAARATDDLEAAGAFAAADGVALLARAVESAEETGDVEVARRGQRALAAFRWVRRATRASGAEPARPDPGRTGEAATAPEKSDGDVPATTSAPVTEPL